MPVEFKVFGLRIGSIFLDSVADVSENFGFGDVINLRMIFDFIDSSETQVGGSNCLLTPGR